MFLVNSRLSLFTAAPACSGSKSLHRPEHPFFRSYGANWSSSLRRVLPSALECSSRPPVSVYGTDACNLTRGFSWQCGIRQLLHPKDPRPFTPQPCVVRICLDYGSHAWAAIQCGSLPDPPASPHRSNGYKTVQESLCLFSIAYALRPRLRVRLTPGGVTWPGNPWTFGGQDSHLSFRY